MLPVPGWAQVQVQAETSFAIPISLCKLKFPTLQVRRISSVSAVACPEAAAPLPPTNTHPTPTPAVDGGGAAGHKPPDWKKLSSKDLRISTSMIDKPTRLVLKTLKKKGISFPCLRSVFSYTISF